MRNSETRVELWIYACTCQSTNLTQALSGEEPEEAIAIDEPYLHLRASMSFPGVSRHRRMSTDCWRTTAKASSKRRAWSSTGAGGGGDVIVLDQRVEGDFGAPARSIHCRAANCHVLGWEPVSVRFVDKHVLVQYKSSWTCCTSPERHGVASVHGGASANVRAYSSVFFTSQ